MGGSGRSKKVSRARERLSFVPGVLVGRTFVPGVLGGRYRLLRGGLNGERRRPPDHPNNTLSTFLPRTRTSYVST